MLRRCAARLAFWLIPRLVLICRGPRYTNAQATWLRPRD
jgi:hypothetical protein